MNSILSTPKLLAVGGAAIVASGAYAIGTQAGGGTADAASKGSTARTASGSTGTTGAAGRGHRGERLDAAASALGVSVEKLRTALGELRPEKGDRGEKRTEFAAALAKGLGVDEAKVTAALKAQKDTKKANRGERSERRGGPRFDPAAFAKAVGVSEAKLESTLKALRSDRQKEHEAKRAAFVKALADKLGVSEAKVTEVFGKDGRGPFGGPGRGGPGHHGGRGHRRAGAPFESRP